MQDEIIKDEYDSEDWDKAVYLVDRGFIKSDSTVDKHDNIRQTAIAIHNVKMRSYDEYIKNGGKPAFEGKG
jgi:hypothetical protein